MIAAVLLIAVAAAWLALQRADIAWSTLEAKYAGPASRYMDMPGGVRLHYRDQGARAGPAVVLVHGFGASLLDWEPWVAALGGDYRLISVDLPGHGLTRAPPGYVASMDGDADLVDRLATALDVRPYVVVGNSMGGGVAWDDALRHGDHLRGLVLVDSVGIPDPKRREGGPLIFKLLANPVGRALIKNLDTTALVRNGLRSAFVDPNLVTPALVDRYVELSRAPGHRDILLAMNAGPHKAVTPQTFSAIAVPTLVMHGDVDALIPASGGRALAAAIPGARLIVYPGVGHVPMEQIPDRSAADLRAFLASLDSKAPS